MTEQLATLPEPRSQIAIAERGVRLSNFDELARFCLAISKSRLAPKGFETPEAIMVAVQMGLEVGLGPLAALANICVINGKPALYGDAALALVRASGQLDEFAEYFDREGVRVESLTAPLQPGDRAICRSHRRGYATPRITIFTFEDAKHARLIGKAGPWTEYPARMLQFRARGFNLRDEFSDILKGFPVAEEVGDYPVRSLSVGRAREEDAAAGLILPSDEGALPSVRHEVEEVLAPHETADGNVTSNSEPGMLL